MPFAITKLVWIIWTEGCYDRTTTIVYFKDDGSILHVKKEIVSSSFDCCQNSSQVPRLDHHGDVKVEPDPELLEGVDEPSLRPDERAGLDLL